MGETNSDLESARRLLFAMILSLALCLVQPASSEEIRIGVVSPQTGPISQVGQTFRRATEMADEDRDTGNRVTFIFEDDGFQPRNAVLAVQKLLDAESVKGLMLFGSGSSLAVADIVDRKQIPFIAVGISPKITQGRQYVFRHMPLVEKQGELLAREASARGISTVALVTSQQEGMIAIKDAVRAALGTRVVLEEDLVMGDADARAVVSKIAHLNPQMVCLFLVPPQLSALPRQLREAGYRGQFCSGPAAQNEAEVKAAGGALEGTVFATVDDHDAIDFRDRYRVRYGEEPTVDGLHGYDVAALFIEAAASGRDMKEYFQGLKSFHGILGTYGVLPQNFFDVPAALKVIRNGKFEALHERAS